MKDRQPVVSVIMSVYNEKEEWIMESVNSILNQTFSDLEFIIVNDNPTNKECIDILEKVEKLDPRIVILTNEMNQGLSYSMNKAIQYSQGSYIARMDSDDISHPSRIRKQVDYLNSNKDISIVGTQIMMFGDKNKLWFNLTEHEELKAKLFFKCCIAHPSVMFRKSDLEHSKLYYDNNFRTAQDYNLWSRAILKLNIANLNEVLLLYRTHNKQVTNRKNEQQQNSFGISHLNLLKVILPLMSEEEIKISQYIWNNKDLETSNKQKSFYKLINKIIKANKLCNLFKPSEFDMPLVNILIKKRHNISLRCILMFIKYAFENSIFSVLKRKRRKIRIKHKITEDLRVNKIEWIESYIQK